MKSFFLDKLPDCITVAGKSFFIKTDFRVWLGFSQTIQENKAVIDEADFVYADEVPSAELKAEAFKQLMEFYHPEPELPRSNGGGSEKVLDYVIDSQLIFAAFWEQYGIDLMATDENGHFLQMHWHKFLALLAGLHGTKLNDVMGWRCWKGDTKTDYGKTMQNLRNAWALPEASEEREQVQKDLDSFNSLFEKKTEKS